jgi:hypothetical protein
VPGQDSDHVPGQDSDHVPGQDSDHVPSRTRIMCPDSDHVPGQDSDHVPGQDSDTRMRRCFGTNLNRTRPDGPLTRIPDPDSDSGPESVGCGRWDTPSPCRHGSLTRTTGSGRASTARQP